MNHIALTAILALVCTLNAHTQPPNSLTTKEIKEGYQLLFDGKTLDGWINNASEYTVENGAIAKKAAGFGNLYTHQRYDNFVLRFDFQLTPGANNGLGLRHTVETKGYKGMELQILDNDDPQYKELKPYQYHGGLYNYAAAKRGHLKPTGEWNTQEVTAQGTHIKIVLNGTLILDVDLKEVTKDLPPEKIQEGLLSPKGHIAFLGHDSVVKFRNIRIKPLTKP